MRISGLLRRLVWVAVTVAGQIASPVRAAPDTPPLSVYGSLPGFERAAISSSGDHIALIGSIAGKRQLVILDKDGNVLKSMAMEKAKIRSVSWAGDAFVLLEKSDTVSLDPDFSAEKAELSAIIVLPINGAKPWSVFDRKTQITGGVRGNYGTVEKDGKWFGYFGGITLDRTAGDAYLNNTHPHLYEVDLQSTAPRQIAQRTDREFGWRSWLVGADGTVSARFDFEKDGKWSLRNGSGDTIASGLDRLGNADLIGLGSVADTVIYAEADKDGDNHWFQLPLAGGAAQEVFGDTALHSTLFDKRRRMLIGYEADGDMPSYQLLDARRQKVIVATQKAFPGLAMHLIDWNDRFDRLIVMTEGTGDPQTWWLVDIKTGDAKVLGTSYPMFASAVAPVSMIHYKGVGDLDIAAVLTLPPGKEAKGLPVIILPHGGPTARDYPGFDWWAQAFAARGYAVLQPNFRGSTGYGVAFQRAGKGEWGRKMQSDISDGLTELVRRGIADPKRACIMGASYGGYAALAGVTLQHGIYRCAVAVAGIGDLKKMIASDVSDSGGNPVLRRALKDELGSGRELTEVSPIRFAASVEAPVLLIHGKDDTVVAYDQSNDMANALRKAGKVVEFVTLPGEDHWLSKSETRLAMLQASVAFVEKYNPPDAAPASGLAGH